MADVTTIVEEVRSVLETNLADPWDFATGSTRSNYIFTNDVRMSGNFPKVLVKTDPTDLKRQTWGGGGGYTGGTVSYKTKCSSIIRIFYFNKSEQKYYVTGTTTTDIVSIDGDATTISVNSVAHGLSVDSVVFIAGTTNYDGQYKVATVTDDDNYTIADTTHDVASEATGTSALAITYEDGGSNASRSLNQYMLKLIHDTLKAQRASLTSAKTLNYGSISNTDVEAGNLYYGFIPIMVTWIE